MKEQVLNEIVKFDSTAEYYQQLEKSIWEIRAVMRQLLLMENCLE